MNHNWNFQRDGRERGMDIHFLELHNSFSCHYFVNNFCSTKLNHRFLMVKVKTKLITSSEGSKRLDMCEFFNRSIVGDQGSLKESCSILAKFDGFHCLKCFCSIFAVLISFIRLRESHA